VIICVGEVGNASKMNLVLQLMAGVTLAGLAEGMALADRAGLQQKDVLEVLELTSLACSTMIEKSKGEYLLCSLIFLYVSYVVPVYQIIIC
jgi:3-hydroxyisobutyrate dehydrogenase-like beta-hydroxyacid dehydrogenase